MSSGAMYSIVAQSELGDREWGLAKLLGGVLLMSQYEMAAFCLRKIRVIQEAKQLQRQTVVWLKLKCLKTSLLCS